MPNSSATGVSNGAPLRVGDDDGVNHSISLEYQRFRGHLEHLRCQTRQEGRSSCQDPGRRLHGSQVNRLVSCHGASRYARKANRIRQSHAEGDT